MYFPSAADGKSYWCQNDGMLLARSMPEDLLNYSAWQVLVDLKPVGGGALAPEWVSNAWVPTVGSGGDTGGGASAPSDRAVYAFTYPLMTGENGIVTFNPVLQRYFLPNFSFLHPNRSTPLA